MHAKQTTGISPRLSGLVINQADWSDPVIVIGESRFDDSLFSTPDATMNVQRPTPKAGNKRINTVGARMLPYDKKSMASKSRKSNLGPTEAAGHTKRGSENSNESADIYIEDNTFVKALTDVHIPGMKSVWEHHLVFGTCKGSYPAPTIRVLIIVTSLILEMALVGGAYYS